LSMEKLPRLSWLVKKYSKIAAEFIKVCSAKCKGVES
jgi:hypothetical protein